MSAPDAAPTTRLAGLAAQLLSTHLDGVDPQTDQAVDEAVERLAGAILDWHDSLALGRRRPTRPAGPSRPPAAPAAVDPAELTDPARLDRVGATTQACARELAVSAGFLRRVAARTVADAPPVDPALLDDGPRLAAAADELAEALVHLAQVAGEQRQLLARAGEDPTRRAVQAERSAAVLRRAQLRLVQVATATVRP